MKFMTPLLISTLSFALLAQDADLTKMKRDIDILTSALKTSLSFERKGLEADRHELHDLLEDIHIKGIYLKHQGVLLTVEFSQFGHYFLSDIGTDFLPLGDLVIPEVTIIESTDEEDLEESFEAMEDALDEASDVISDLDDLPNAELQREMAELKRLQREELRETRERYRESREELYQKRSLSEKERAEVLAEMEARKKEIEQITKQYQSKITEIKEKQRVAWTEQMQKMEQTIVEILCDYGSAMRSLPDDEHITVLLVNGELAASGRFQDKIFVFKKSDLSACRDGDIKPASLLERGAPYTY